GTAAAPAWAWSRHHLVVLALRLREQNRQLIVLALLTAFNLRAVVIRRSYRRALGLNASAIHFLDRDALCFRRSFILHHIDHSSTPPVGQYPHRFRPTS